MTYLGTPTLSGSAPVWDGQKFTSSQIVRSRYPDIDADTLLAWDLGVFSPEANGGVTANLGNGGSAANGTIFSPHTFGVLSAPGAKGIGTPGTASTNIWSANGTPIYTAVRQPIETAGEFTMAAWFNLVALPRSGGATRIFWKASGISWPEGDEYTRAGIGFGSSSPPTLNAWANTTTTQISHAVPMDGLGGRRTTIGPHFVCATHKITAGSYESKLYFDGALISTLTGASSAFRIGATDTTRDGVWGVAQDPGASADTVEGLYYAVRVDKVARSAAWVEDAARRFFGW